MQFFLLEASCDLNRKYDLVAVGALTYSGIHITYSPLRLTELPGLVGPPEVCAWALRMLYVKEEGAHFLPCMLHCPIAFTYKHHPERQKQKLLNDDREQSIKPSLHPSEHQSWATTPSTRHWDASLMLRPGLQPDPSLSFVLWTKSRFTVMLINLQLQRLSTAQAGSLRELKGNHKMFFPGGRVVESPTCQYRHVQSEFLEDSTCHGAVKPVYHNC